MQYFTESIITDRDLTGEFAAYDTKVLRKWVGDALTEVHEYIPNLDALVASGQIAIDSVEKLVAKAVIGALRNVDGLKAMSDGDVSLSRFGDGFVWIRQSDIDRLLRRGQSRRFGTARVGRAW